MKENHDTIYLEQAIAMATKSYDMGAFPAGAVVVKGDEIISSAISAKFPKITLHADSKAIDTAIEKLNTQLTDCTLYLSMQPCLMCMSRAYWAGIRRIVYVISKESVPHEVCYESNLDHLEIVKSFNEEIEMVHVKDLAQVALSTVNKWLKENVK